uniref:Uncharacterized protein n=1 Tax=Timema cristinae TaxID=61476 RepID=A0A7R9DE75_TIMCR|nr:unnamed protein product [Timema cristinae]
MLLCQARSILHDVSVAPRVEVVPGCSAAVCCSIFRQLSWLAARVWLISQSKASICQDSSDAMVPASEVVGLRLNRTSFRGLVIGLCLPNWDGEQIIAEFVSSCKGLKDIHSDTELNIRLKELQCRVKASSNLYVQALLASLPS